MPLLLWHGHIWPYGHVITVIVSKHLHFSKHHCAWVPPQRTASRAIDSIGKIILRIILSSPYPLGGAINHCHPGKKQFQKQFFPHCNTALELLLSMYHHQCALCIMWYLMWLWLRDSCLWNDVNGTELLHTVPESNSTSLTMWSLKWIGLQWIDFFIYSLFSIFSWLFRRYNGIPHWPKSQQAVYLDWFLFLIWQFPKKRKISRSDFKELKITHFILVCFFQKHYKCAFVLWQTMWP